MKYDSLCKYRGLIQTGSIYSMYSYLYAVYKIYKILRVQGKFLKKNYTILRVCGCYQRGCLFPRNSSKNLFSTTPLEQLHNCTPWIQDKKWYRLNVSGENLYIGVLKVPREGFDCVFPQVLAWNDGWFFKFRLWRIIKFPKKWHKYMKKKLIALSIYLLITHFSDSGT